MPDPRYRAVAVITDGLTFQTPAFGLSLGSQRYVGPIAVVGDHPYYVRGTTYPGNFTFHILLFTDRPLAQVVADLNRGLTTGTVCYVEPMPFELATPQAVSMATPGQTIGHTRLEHSRFDVQDWRPHSVR